MAHFVVLVLVFLTISSWELKTIDSQSYADHNYSPSITRYTRDIHLKQGVIQGIVVKPKVNRDLSSVAVYMGIPYAAPPVGELRFMPSGSAPSWFGTKYADVFGPVCPQNWPNTRNMTMERKQYFMRLKEHLQNQSEDCLYLNIYAPYQETDGGTRRYPVIVFIHGESFEWNSGNPYDGSVLASYGKVIVVTLNYRLGILGFLKAGTEDHSRGNFGLVDQIAALLWVKENIAAFGGDPGSVTLLGHGTGAACASLLMLSPMVLQEGEVLFQRAILMGGTALADWALAGNPSDVTYQVAERLNCQIHDDFAGCLRMKRLDEVMNAAVVAPPYRTRFGPVVDSLVVPNDPKKSMTTYSDIFRRFELMYGLTELESIHLLDPVALTHGMLEKERDQELGNYMKSRCENSPELCIARTLAQYTDSTLRDEEYAGYMGHGQDKAHLTRDVLLDILSDARTAAPVVQMGRYHAALNLQSYFYVFTHKTNSREYIGNKTYSGEDLPYILGIPLDGSKFHFTDRYTEQERLLSEIMMTYVSNFAYTGNPNVPSKNDFHTLGPATWKKFNIDWPEFDIKKQRYLQLDTPPSVRSHYREDKINFWNKLFAQISIPNSTTTKIRKPPPFILVHPIGYDRDPSSGMPSRKKEVIYGKPKQIGTAPPDNLAVYGTVINAPPEESKGATMNIIIIVGVIFLVANLILFAGLYYKCYRIKKVKNELEKNDESDGIEDITIKHTKLEDAFIVSDCNLMKMLSKSSKSDDTYEAVKCNTPTNSKYKLSRQMSGSTIDAHTKVRDWIAHEVVQRYSPAYFRKPKPPNVDDKLKELGSTKGSEKLMENDSTLGRSPTRPVSPTDDIIKDHIRPPLVKQSSVSSQKKGKKVDKVSVAVDATPSGRGPSVLQQIPIELSKSLDYPTYKPEMPLRRSVTLEDFSCRKTCGPRQNVTQSTTNINLRTPQAGEVIKISHAHTRSDPVQDIYSRTKRLRTFDPKADVNVTSREEPEKPKELTPEEALQTIKRRNFPKVLPDLPSKEALAHKRRSMPISSHLIQSIPEITITPSKSASANKSLNKLPPAPPPRTTSTLGRKPPNPGGVPYSQSEPMLAEEPPSPPEPVIACNNLFIGPLIPRNIKKGYSEDKLDTSPIYESLRIPRKRENEGDNATPKAIVTADPSQPIKKLEPKVIIRPTMTRNLSDPKKNITRVVVSDNLPEIHDKKKETEQKVEEKTDQSKIVDETDKNKPKPNTSAIPVRTNSIKGKPESQIQPKPSQIPTLVKTSTTSLNKESSSSESTSPSEESDTGTVVKKV